MPFRVERLPGEFEFGAVVRDLSPGDLSDEATRHAIHDLWLDRGLVVSTTTTIM